MASFYHDIASVQITDAEGNSLQGNGVEAFGPIEKKVGRSIKNTYKNRSTNTKELRSKVTERAKQPFAERPKTQEGQAMQNAMKQASQQNMNMRFKNGAEVDLKTFCTYADAFLIELDAYDEFHDYMQTNYKVPPSLDELVKGFNAFLKETDTLDLFVDFFNNQEA